jgi:PAS domain S-box-containing protein
MLHVDSTGVSEEQLDSRRRVGYQMRAERGTDAFFIRDVDRVGGYNGDNRLIEIATPTTASGTDAGICCLAAVLDVPRMLGAIAAEIKSGDTGYCWIIDEKGRFLFHPKSDFIGKVAYEARREMMPELSFGQINAIQAEHMLMGQEGVGGYVSGWHRDVSGEMEKLIAFSPLRVDDTEWIWSVAVVAPVSEVRAVINRMYFRQTILESLLIVGIFVISFMAFAYKRRLSNVLVQKLRRTQRSLHQTEEYYHAIFESAADPIYLIDEDHTFIEMNMFTAKILGAIEVHHKGWETDDQYLPKRFIGRSIGEIMPEKESQFLEEKVREVFSRNRMESFENHSWLGDRKLHFNTKYIPIFDEDDKVNSVLGISRDVTEKKEMEHLIYNTEKLASLGTLAAGVAHEINNPLSIILGFSDLMLDRADEGSQQYEDLKLIEENCLNCKRIVENLMSFARVTEGIEGVVDLNLAIDTVVKVVENTLLTNKVELVIDVQPGLPRVTGDTRELQQVFFNLINNAVYAMKESGGKLGIKTTARSDQVEIRVTDDGVGIPKGIGNQVFEPFFTTKKVGEGTGLGLSVSYGILKKYGGSISYTSIVAGESGSGSGTTFTVTLPIYKES